MQGCHSKHLSQGVCVITVRDYFSLPAPPGIENSIGQSYCERVRTQPLLFAVELLFFCFVSFGCSSKEVGEEGGREAHRCAGAGMCAAYKNHSADHLAHNLVPVYDTVYRPPNAGIAPGSCAISGKEYIYIVLVVRV